MNSALLKKILNAAKASSDFTASEIKNIREVLAEELFIERQLRDDDFRDFVDKYRRSRGAIPKELFRRDVKKAYRAEKKKRV